MTQPKGCFAWNDVDMTVKSKTPSPRCAHTGWEYSGKLWVFGGSGPSPIGYLNDNGDHVNGYTNQLLCFDPSSEEWVNPKCSGSVPSPRCAHATTVIGNKVWLYGGRNIHVLPGELYQLSMHSLIWIQIQTNGPNPMRRWNLTLDAVGDNKIVLHGGTGSQPMHTQTWILDIPSQMWKKYISGIDHSRLSHSGTKGLNNCVFVVGGKKYPKDDIDTITFLVMLEPKSLQ